MRRTSSATSSLTLIAALLLGAGCKTSETVYVPSGEPMLLAEPVKARVAVSDGHGHLVKSRNRVTIPEGWIAVPDLGTDGDGPTPGSPATHPAGGR